MSTIFPLTGIDLGDPTPGTFRELAMGRGTGGGGQAAREVLLIANKVAGIGSGSVDGLSETLNTPRLITSEQDVIDRAGYKSEALLMYKTFRRVNPGTDVKLAIVPPGTGSASVDFVFVNASTAATAVKISAYGEDLYVGVANGDSITAIGDAVEDAVNAKLDWPFTASNAAGTVTITASIAGARYDTHLNRLRMAFTKPTATTVTKGSLTAGSTDDDQTTLIANLASERIFYQVNPKDVVAGPTSTDNGIGEHLAALQTANLPINGKDQVLIAACAGTNANSITVATAMNWGRSFLVWAEDNDLPPGLVATIFAAALSLKEAGDRGARLADYGPGGVGGALPIPDPFDKTDRPSSAEIKAALNNGVTPIAFTPNGQPYIVWHVTTYSVTNSVKDYRQRPGHLPSVVSDFWEGVAIRWSQLKQDRWASDPVEGEKPRAGFSYPRDVKSLVGKVVDEKIDGALATLDPAKRETMKANVEVGNLGVGPSVRAPIFAVRHNLKAWFLIEEQSPAI